MNLANVVLPEKEPRNGEEVKIIVHDFMQPFISTLALNHPEWTFNGSQGAWSHNFGKGHCYAYYKFGVVEKYEEVCTLAMSVYNGKNVYCIDNSRIGKERQRGSGMRTKDMKKALRQVAKYVRRLDAVEVSEGSKEKAEGVLYSVARGKSNQYESEWNTLVKTVLVPYATEHQQEIRKYAQDKHINYNFEALDTKREEASVTKYIDDCHKGGKCLVVTRLDSGYAIRPNTGVVEVKQSEDLSDYMRKALGLLKLVQPSQVVEAVGLRVDEDVFLVVAEEHQ
jgi:hypothetical protein